MKLKLTLCRDSGSQVDLSVSLDATARISDVARALEAADPLRTAGSELTATALKIVAPDGGAEVDLPGTDVVVESALGSGALVKLVHGTRAAEGRSARGGLARMEVMVGPDAGTTFELGEGTYVVGRDADCDITLNDVFVSKEHARLTVGQAIEMVDLNSANGLVVDGGLVQRVVVQDHHHILLGDTTVRLQRTSRVTLSQPASAGGTVAFNRPPKVEARYPGKEFPRPEVPTEEVKPIFPWPAMLLPVLAGLVSYAFTKSPYSLVMVAMAPMMMLGNQLTTSGTRKRTEQHQIGRFETQLESLDRMLQEQQPIERGVRQEEAPSVGLVLADALSRGSRMWTRRPEHGSFLTLRLGMGAMPSRNRVTQPEGQNNGLQAYTDKLEDLIDRYRMIDDVPVIDNLRSLGALGVAGGPRERADVARAYLVQLLGAHSPAELVVVALVGPGSSPDFEWLKWTPHATSSHSPFGEPLLADSQASGAAALAALEELVSLRVATDRMDTRLGAIDEDKSAMAAAAAVGATVDDGLPLPVVVVLVTDDAPVDRARLVQLAERSAAAGVYPIFVAPTVADLPGVCRTFVSCHEDGTAHVGLVRLGVEVDAAVEAVDLASAARFARRLAPVVDGGALVEDASDLPTTVPLTSLLGVAMLDSAETVVERWRENASIQHEASALRSRRSPTLRALVGQAGVDAMHLDLRTQGPHALVGGTTGAGKSEFLQSWVLGMAAEYSPERVTFLFVDYKGGSAFADCVELPHTVGLVTDLSPHLVRRALVSLKAELHHREHLFNAKKVKDLLELERKGDPDSPPALVIVIDEFAALVTEVPDFVDGVIDVAQRGRSLGIHLIMATQRPAGVIRDNLRANTNLRIALRMADEHDSQDVVGEKVAALFDPGLPGRGAAKTGPGRLAIFQSAYAGGWTSDEVEPVKVDITELQFGIASAWREPETDVVLVEEADRGPTDQKRLVKQFSRAAELAATRHPRKPWQPELSEIYDLMLLGQRSDTELVLGVSDVPERQLQEAAYFRPDDDGNLVVYGTGGSGKTVLLRSLAVAAGITPRSGPVEVYCLDFAAGGLTMLEQLPHVGAVISGDDQARINRLMKMLKQRLEERSRLFPATHAGSITEYRELAGMLDEPRILLLLDNYPAFRDQYEAVGARSFPHDVLIQLLSEGRQLGLHVVLTADRPGTVPSAVASASPRKIALRLADDQSYALLDMPRDVLGLESPPGRAMVDGVETQLAILGGSRVVSDQSSAIVRLSAAVTRTGRKSAQAIGSLPQEVHLDELPVTVGEDPVLGLDEASLAPIGFEAVGLFVLAGGPGSGRSTAFVSMARSIARAFPEMERVYLGGPRSASAKSDVWNRVLTKPVEISTWADEAVATLSSAPCVIFVEGLPELGASEAEFALTELAKAVGNSDSFLLAEGETSAMGAGWGLAGTVNAARRGLVLQPESYDGDALFKTEFPRVSRADFPPGRGFLVQGGRITTVQIPLS